MALPTFSTNPPDVNIKPAEMGETRPRFRVSVKQTAKGAHYFDATIEYGSPVMPLKVNTQDLGDERTITLGEQLLSVLKGAEAAFRADGREVVVEAKAA